MTVEIAEVLAATGGAASGARTGKVTKETAFAQAIALADDVVATSEKSARFGAQIAALAANNHGSARKIETSSADLQRKALTLGDKLSDHGDAAGRMDTQAAGAQAAVQKIAEISRETSVASDQVAAAVSHQFETLKRLSGITDQVAIYAESVRTSLDHFKTDDVCLETHGNETLKKAA
jgi:hypothetical protein